MKHVALVSFCSWVRREEALCSHKVLVLPKAKLQNRISVFLNSLPMYLGLASPSLPPNRKE